MSEMTPESRRSVRNLSRREVILDGLVLGALTAGVPGMSWLAAEDKPVKVDSGVGVPEDIRSSQSTVMESATGQVRKFRTGEKVFRDADDVVGSVPEEFLARNFIWSTKNGVEATCRSAGHVYAITAKGSEQEKLLVTKGFKPLDLAAFQVFADDPAKAVAYQKRVEEGERLKFGSWVLLIFGPEERGGVPCSQMRSLTPPVLLPDGSEFKTWEVAEHKFSATLYVDQSHPAASDNNPGTKDRPLKTINRAAQLLQPGERVVVGAGVYRECVRPLRGGTDPQHMISYEAAPGAKVVIRGSELLPPKWVPSQPWTQDNRFQPMAKTVQRIWMMHLPPELFPGYNPFGIANYRQVDQMSYWNVSEVFSERRAQLYLQVSGLLFQDGIRLEQVTHYTDLFTNEGSYWVETNGVTIHISPYGGIDPNLAQWEATAREQIFASENYFLGYIRVRGFEMEYAGNSFPFPQRGVISAMMGHHWIIEDNTLQWANSVGIDIGDQGEPTSNRPEILGYHIVRRNTLNDMGTTGITGPGPFNSLVEDNVFHRNAWHDMELLAECGAIKTHHNLNVLMRRNLIFDTLHGAGIYIDSSNSNSRICQNVIVGTGTYIGLQTIGPGTGGIYVEAAMAPNLVDHNFVWGSTQTNGIYSYTSSKVVIAHNLVGNCAMAAIRIVDMPGRGAIPSGGNTVVNNIVVNNGWNIDFYSPQNVSDYNLLGKTRLPHPYHLGRDTSDLDLGGHFKNSGKPEQLSLSGWRGTYGLDLHSSEADITAEFDPETLELVWSVRRGSIAGLPMAGMENDFWSQPAAASIVPGPFGSIPKESTRIVLDPRPPTPSRE
jgi:hypothetical protein